MTTVDRNCKDMLSESDKTCEGHVQCIFHPKIQKKEIRCYILPLFLYSQNIFITIKHISPPNSHCMQKKINNSICTVLL